jgi:type IV secretion system protein VirD4
MHEIDFLRPFAPETFGSAKFLTRLEAIELRLYERGKDDKLCPYVGGLADGSGPGDTATMLYARSASFIPGRGMDDLREGSGHLLTVAPTRAGKGTGQIIPNLLRWSGSCIVIDVKGENYSTTASFRQEDLGQRVLRFAPFEQITSVWNPITSIRANRDSDKQTPQEEEDARFLVNLLVTPSGSTNDRFWENSARNFLEGLVLHVSTSPLSRLSAEKAEQPEHQCEIRERSMREVRRLLTLDERPFSSLLKDMSQSKRPIIAQAGNTMAKLSKGEGRTGNSILAIALEQTAVWAYSRVHRATYKGKADPGADGEPAQNDFEFRDLRDANTTLYLVVPPEYLAEYRSVLRVLIGTAMRDMRRTYRGEVQTKAPVLFLLDEFPQLGYMQPIEQSLLYIAGYGVRFWFFVQDISQLQLHYPNSWRTFMANTGTQCFFGVSDIATANLVSEMAGTTTVENRGYGQNVARTTGESGSKTQQTGESQGYGGSTSSSSESYTTGWQSSWTEGQSAQIGWVGRRLISPDEVLRMHDEEQIIFMKGLKPIRATKMPYFKKKDLNSLVRPPPIEIDFERTGGRP